jgi:hypothetical protein
MTIEALLRPLEPGQQAAIRGVLANLGWDRWDGEAISDGERTVGRRRLLLSLNPTWSPITVSKTGTFSSKLRRTAPITQRLCFD